MYSFTSRFLKVVRVVTIVYIIIQSAQILGMFLNIASGLQFLALLTYLGALGLIIFGTSQWSRSLSRSFMMWGSFLAITAYVVWVWELASLQKADFQSYLMNPGMFLIFAAWPTAVLIGSVIVRTPKNTKPLKK